MRIIDDKTFDSLPERIDALKNELSLLEEQVKALPVSELVEEPAASTEESAVDAGQPLEAGQVHPRFAAAEYGLTSTAAPAEPELVVAEPELVVAEPEPVAPAVILSEALSLSKGEAKDLPESQDLPVDEPEEPIDIAPVDDTPIDISISDVEDMPDDVGQPLEEPAGPRSLSEVEGPVVRHRSPAGQSILDTAKADTAVMDIMAEKQAWRTDRPGMPVKNIISAISLNDRVLLINVLFGEDPMLFQETIAKFNAMGSLSEALDFISENHPDWDMNSEPVYRLMMAVRRKLS